MYLAPPIRIDYLGRTLKEAIKSLIRRLPFALSRNHGYDLQTRKVISRVCRTDSNCVDVGCHKGEVLDLMLAAAPKGHHYGFEPIPAMYEELKLRYAGKAEISSVALSSTQGNSTFNHVVSNPAYSGLIKRSYDRPDEKDTTITVKTDLLDNVLPKEFQVDLIKIDVEGGELGVLKGSQETIRRCRPTIIFEHGLGASDHYGTRPEMVFALLDGLDMNVNTMKRWLHGERALSQVEFKQQFETGKNYYFIAYPR